MTTYIQQIPTKTNNIQRCHTNIYKYDRTIYTKTLTAPIFKSKPLFIAHLRHTQLTQPLAGFSLTVPMQRFSVKLLLGAKVRSGTQTSGISGQIQRPAPKIAYSNLGAVNSYTANLASSNINMHLAISSRIKPRVIPCWRFVQALARQSVANQTWGQRGLALHQLYENTLQDVVLSAAENGRFDSSIPKQCRGC